MTTLEEYLKFNPYDSEEERNLAEFARKIQDDRDKWRGIAERLAGCFERITKMHVGGETQARVMQIMAKDAITVFEEAKK